MGQIQARLRTIRFVLVLVRSRLPCALGTVPAGSVGSRAFETSLSRSMYSYRGVLCRE